MRSLTIVLGLTVLFLQSRILFHTPPNFPPTSVVHRQSNFHLVTPDIWRSAQPSYQSLKLMKFYGLKTVVNLRWERRVVGTEKKWADKLGLQYFSRPMDANETQKPEDLKKTLEIISAKENQPVLLHCAAGKDRTGLIIAMYKLQQGMVTFDQAHKEMLMYGYSEQEYPGLLDALRKWYGEKKPGVSENKQEET